MLRDIHLSRGNHSRSGGLVWLVGGEGGREEGGGEGRTGEGEKKRERERV